MWLRHLLYSLYFVTLLNQLNSAITRYFIPRLPCLSTVYLKRDQEREALTTMIAELVSVLSLTIMMNMFVVLCCVVTMYVAVMAANERRVFPLQGPEMEGQHQIADHGAADWRPAAVRRNRQNFNGRIGNRARPQEHDDLAR